MWREKAATGAQCTGYFIIVTRKHLHCESLKWSFEEGLLVLILPIAFALTF